MPAVADRPVVAAALDDTAVRTATPPRLRPPGPDVGDAAPAGGPVALHGATWETYLAVADGPENGGFRFAHDGTGGTGVLEIETPPEFTHENVSRLVASLIAAFLGERDRDYASAGSLHLRRPRRRGAQPDKLFFINGAEAVRATADGPGTGYPVPDLAVEVVVGSPLSGSKRATYAELGVPELWVWRNGAPAVNRLTDGPPADRTYEPVDASEALPGFPLDLAADLLRRRNELRTPDLLRTFRAAVRPA